MYIVGLTGLIGSGKSEVTNCFARLNVPIIDTDKISRNITNSGGEAIEPIKQIIGSQYILSDGSLDRNKIRQLIFNNYAILIKFETIMHEIIYNKVKTEIANLNSIYIIIAVPLLFKSAKYLNIISRSIFVDAPIKQIVNRLKNRNDFLVSDIRSIIKHQISPGRQRSLATDIIVNNSTLSILEKKVAMLNNNYMAIFK